MAEYKGKEIIVTPLSSKLNEIEAKRKEALKAIFNGAYGVARFLPWVRYVTDVGDVFGVTDNPDTSDILLLWSGPSGELIEHMYDMGKPPANLKGFDLEDWKKTVRTVKLPAKIFSTFLLFPAIVGDALLSTRDWILMPQKVDDYRRAVGVSDNDAKAMLQFRPSIMPMGMEGTYDVLGFKVGGLFTFPTNLLTKNLKRINGNYKRNLGVPSSSRPMYNSNRIIKKGEEGLKFNSTETVVPELNNYLLSDIISDFYSYKNPVDFNSKFQNNEYSDLSNFKSIDEILLEVLLNISGERQPYTYNNPGFNVDAAISYLKEHTHLSSTGYCARAVRKALEAGGLDTSKRPRYANQYNDYLKTIGFKSILASNNTGNKLPENYNPVKGDIIVLDSGEMGHIAMFDGKDWVSDFKLKTFHGLKNSNYKKYTIWRYGV